MPRSPLTSILIQATILNAISNVLAQVIDQYKKDGPFTLNTPALLQFIAYAIIIVPINFSFQNWLEAAFPGFPSWQGSRHVRAQPSLDLGVKVDILPVSATATEKEKEKEKEKEETAKGGGGGGWFFQPKKTNKKARSGTWNFAMKFVLDQTVGSVLNIVLFVMLINLLKGVAWGRTWELVCQDFNPIMIARLKYRPVVSTLMYTVVPVERRVVFGSACGVIWGVYLSLYAAV